MATSIAVVVDQIFAHYCKAFVQFMFRIRVARANLILSKLSSL